MTPHELAKVASKLPLSKSTIERNRDALAGRVCATKPEPNTMKNRIRQSSKPLMNKLESEFYAIIKDKYPNYPAIRIQAKTYKIANGLRYTPDFTTSSWPIPDEPCCETAWEVKGKWVDGDSFPKLKMAAAAWPEIRWILVWKDEFDMWHEQIILV